MTYILHRLFAVIRLLDRMNLPLLRVVPSEAKRQWVRKVSNSLLPLLVRRGVEIDGLRFYLPRAFIRSYLIGFERDVTQILQIQLRPGMVVIDVGANIGYHTLHAARLVGPTGQVYAVEPGPDNLDCLRENVRFNQFDNIEILPYAAGAERRHQDFYLKANQATHGFYRTGVSRVISTLRVRLVPLDEVIKGPVDFVKIDVEGAEIEVLRGMQGILEANPAIALVIEWNYPALQAAGHAPLELPRFLIEMGFTLTVIGDGAIFHRPEEAAHYLGRTNLGNARYVNLFASRNPPPES